MPKLLEPTYKTLQFIFYMGWSDQLAKYRYSKLGVLWPLVVISISVFGLAYVWSRVLDNNFMHMVVKLTYGLPLWYFISQSIVLSSVVFFQSRGLIKNYKINLRTIVAIAFMRPTITLFLNFPLIIAVTIFAKDVSLISAVVSVIGFVLVAAALYYTVYVLAYVGAFYRDFEPLISGVMPILFFLTPVIYDKSSLSDASIVFQLNPFSHMLAVVREPLLYGDFPTESYVFLIILLLVMFFLAHLLDKHLSNEVIFWL